MYNQIIIYINKSTSIYVYIGANMNVNTVNIVFVRMCVCVFLPISSWAISMPSMVSEALIATCQTSAATSPFQTRRRCFQPR